MEILSLRDLSVGDATAAYVFVGADFECHSIEDVVREPKVGRPVGRAKLEAWVRTWKIVERTAIISGRYRTIIDFSERFQKQMIHILNVPGWSGIRAHGGLKPEDTEGCPLLGDELYYSAAGPRVRDGKSRPAVDRLFGKIERAIAQGEEVWWEFKQNPASA